MSSKPIHLKLFDSKTERIWTKLLSANELCVIGKGMHHKIIESSEKNRLCAISVPQFDASDEHLSDVI